MKNIDNYILYLFILILPIFPYSQIILAILTILLILITKIIKIIFTKKISFSTGYFDVPVLLISISYILSSILASPSIMDAFIFPGTTTLILLSISFYFIINQMSLQEKKTVTYFIFVSVILYSITMLLSSTKVITTASLVDNLSTSLFIIPLLPIMISLIFKQNEFIYKFLVVVSIFVSIFTVIVSIIVFKPAQLLSFKASTEIALNTLKQHPFLGIGPANYIESFNKYRPYEFNQTNTWANKFTQGSSFLLTNLTENGIVGLITIVTLVAMFVNYMIKTVVSREKVGWGLLGSLDLLSVLLILLSLLIFYQSPVVIFMLFVLLSVITEPKKYEHLMPTKIASLFILLPVFILISIASYKVYILGYAELNYQKSLKTLSENKARETYDLLKKTISLNSKVDRYHRALSAVNLGIANSLAKKEDISENDKEKVTLIIQESINEAKAAVSINNRSSENWQLLGKTYYLLIPLAKGADQFAIDSYKEAIALDPINPNLRINLGEVYMLQKDYKNAIETFKLAVLAKENHPNSHFNLAIAYKEDNQIDKAKLEMNTTLKLLGKENADYEKALKELQNIEELSKPQEAVEPVIEPQIELPQE